MQRILLLSPPLQPVSPEMLFTRLLLDFLSGLRYSHALLEIGPHLWWQQAWPYLATLSSGVIVVLPADASSHRDHLNRLLKSVPPATPCWFIRQPAAKPIADELVRLADAWRLNVYGTNEPVTDAATMQREALRFVNYCYSRANPSREPPPSSPN